MKGYRKIGGGNVRADKRCVEENDNYEMDCQIRTVVHSSIIGEVDGSGCQDFYVVVYKRTAKPPAPIISTGEQNDQPQSDP